MATSDHLSSADLKAVSFGGLINEDVMQQIWDISRIPLPLTDAIGSDSVSNAYTEWTEDRLGDPDLANAAVDGQDLTGNDAAAGDRIGNQCQISTKIVSVTERAQSSSTVGRSNELSYQVMMRQRELRRDVEAISLTGQGSVADNGDTVAGKTAGLMAMITQGDRGTGSGGGFTSGTWAPYVPGTQRGLTETMVRDVAQTVWEAGGNPSLLMSLPGIIRQLSAYMFTDSARIATLTAETNQDGPAKAMGSVNVFLTDFGVELKMVPNRLQQPYDDATAVTPVSVGALFILDPSYARHGFLKGYRVEPLAKTGLADRRSMAVDWCTKVLNREAHGIITDINPATAVTL